MSQPTNETPITTIEWKSVEQDGVPEVSLDAPPHMSYARVLAVMPSGNIAILCWAFDKTAKRECDRRGKWRDDWSCGRLSATPVLWAPLPKVSLAAFDSLKGAKG